MKFVKKKIVEKRPVAGKFDANGNPTTTPVVTQEMVKDVILGDGSSEFSVLQRDGKTRVDVVSVELTADYTPETTFEVQINYATKVFVTVNTVALGATLTGVVALIEFNDPDHPDYWIPSQEGVDRDDALAANEWHLLGVGNWMVDSAEMHKHCLKARVRFKAEAGDPDEDTRIHVTWHHNGHRSDAEMFGNDPLPSD